jgi:hypothetical protein
MEWERLAAIGAIAALGAFGGGEGRLQAITAIAAITVPGMKSMGRGRSSLPLARPSVERGGPEIDWRQPHED